MQQGGAAFLHGLRDLLFLWPCFLFKTETEVEEMHDCNVMMHVVLYRQDDCVC